MMMMQENSIDSARLQESMDGISKKIEMWTIELIRPIQNEIGSLREQIGSINKEFFTFQRDFETLKASHSIEIEKLWIEVYVPRCEEWLKKKVINDHALQLQRINNRLKPYKKIPPAVFQAAKQVFLAVEEDYNREGCSTPTGRKIGTLWDSAEATIVKSPELEKLNAAEIANKVAQDSSMMQIGAKVKSEMQ